MKTQALSALFFIALPFSSAFADGSSSYSYISCQATGDDGQSFKLSHFSQGKGLHIHESSWDNDRSEELEIQNISYERGVKNNRGETVEIKISGSRRNFTLQVDKKKANVVEKSAYDDEAKPTTLSSKGIVVKCIIKTGGAG